MPNYFGEQRFGRGGNNLTAAQAMFAGKRIKDRDKRAIYLSAVRSYLFNQVVSARVQQQLTGELLPGDCLMLADGQSLFCEPEVTRITSYNVCYTKLLRGGRQFADVAAINANWEAEKARERQRKDAAAVSVLDDIPLGLPALSRANKIQKRCASVGFDWTELAPVLDKVHEEIDEVMHEVNQPEPDRERIAEELGDLLV